MLRPLSIGTESVHSCTPLSQVAPALPGQGSTPAQQWFPNAEESHESYVSECRLRLLTGVGGCNSVGPEWGSNGSIFKCILGDSYYRNPPFQGTSDQSSFQERAGLQRANWAFCSAAFEYVFCLSPFIQMVFLSVTTAQPGTSLRNTRGGWAAEGLSLLWPLILVLSWKSHKLLLHSFSQAIKQFQVENPLNWFI